MPSAQARASGHPKKVVLLLPVNRRTRRTSRCSATTRPLDHHDVIYRLRGGRRRLGHSCRDGLVNNLFHRLGNRFRRRHHNDGARLRRFCCRRGCRPRCPATTPTTPRSGLCCRLAVMCGDIDLRRNAIHHSIRRPGSVVSRRRIRRRRLDTFGSIRLRRSVHRTGAVLVVMRSHRQCHGMRPLDGRVHGRNLRRHHVRRDRFTADRLVRAATLVLA